MLARMVGHVTYLSDDGMGTKFGRELQNPQTEKTANLKFKAICTTRDRLFPKASMQTLIS